MTQIVNTRSGVNSSHTLLNGPALNHSGELDSQHATMLKPGTHGHAQPTHHKAESSTTEEGLSNCHGTTIMEPSQKSSLKALSIVICTFSKIQTRCTLILSLCSYLLSGST